MPAATPTPPTAPHAASYWSPPREATPPLSLQGELTRRSVINATTNTTTSTTTRGTTSHCVEYNLYRGTHSCSQGSPLTTNGVTWRPLLSPDSSHSTSQATPTRARAPPTTDRQTQTVGLFYPSGAELQKTHQQRELAVQAAPRRPLLTAVSPGRGGQYVMSSYRVYYIKI